QRPGPTRQVRIVALTASVQPSVVRGYLQAGMQGILGKPLQLESLRQVLAGQAQLPQADTEEGLLDQGLLDTHRSLLGEQKLHSLLQVLADALDQQLPLLTDALAAEDCTEVQHLAHRLAGSADSLGFCALARVLREVEEAAQQTDRPALTALAARLHPSWQQSRALLQQLLAA
ncbi:Hpt domain-containing protein, partial [Pseudomonas protegens]|uniref:Hpt domain-containing protein n=1 Tax=Pseudomonas protegens TaxID=380021 RepID=UPI00223C4AB4